MEQKLVRVKVGANMDIGREYLQCAISNFKATKKQGNGHFLNYHMNKYNGLLMKKQIV